jgi:hypothetical protein
MKELLQKRRRFAVPLLILPALLLTACDGTDEVAAADAPICRVAEEPELLPTDLPEASGVAVSQSGADLLWMHNDSGTEPELFAIDGNGDLLRIVHPAGGDMRDWEDIALSSCAAGTCLFIGDIGDNDARRSEITVYRLPEPRTGDDEPAAPDAFAMRYPSGSIDAEGLFVLPGEQLFIVTKGGQGSIEIYRYPGSLAEAEAGGEPRELELVRSLSNGIVPISDRVTGAGASSDGSWVALRTYTSVLLYLADELLSTAATPVPLTIDIRNLSEAQGEGVAIGPEGSLVLTSEGGAQELPGTVTILWCEALKAPSSNAAPTPAD